MFSHSFRYFHGVRKEYVWLYQRHHLSYIDKNGAMVYSLSVVTDVSHLRDSSHTMPTWSITERLEDGSYIYLIGSELDKLGDKVKKTLFTPRELEILNLTSRGFANKEIAKKIGIGYETVITHRKKILRKTRSKNMPEAISTAISLGYL